MTGAELPKLYFNQQGKMSEIIKKLPQLQNKYRPTPWLSNTHAHLLYFDLIKKKSVKLDYDRIDQLTMQDGGITAIAWVWLRFTTRNPNYRDYAYDYRHT